MRIGVIGTAGRKEDAAKLNKDVYGLMYQDLLKRVSPEDTLVSGGAAYADHLAVRAYLDGHVAHLVLHVPFTSNKAKCAETAIYYYERMYDKTGIDVRKDICESIRRGAEITFQPDTNDYKPMSRRNKLVADDSELLIAYTFGEGDVPKDGGTKITWDMSQSNKIHVPIQSLKLPLVSFREITGDLFKQEADAICITTNGFVKANGECVMGKGCAKQLADMYPHVPKLLGSKINEHGNIVQVLNEGKATAVVAFPVKPAQMVLAEAEDLDEVVSHMKSKFNKGDTVPGWACKAQLDIILRSAEELVVLADYYGWKKVILPRAGCGAGELEWSTVRKHLSDILDDRFYVITY